MTTLLLAEHDNKTLKDATNKALTAAKALGADVHVLVAGKGCRAVAEAAAKLDGVNKVLLADGAAYEHMLAEPVAALVRSLAPAYDAIVAPATTTGKNVMPRVAALLDVMQISDIIKVIAPDTFERLDLCRQRGADRALEGQDQGHHGAHLDVPGDGRRRFCADRGSGRGGRSRHLHLRRRGAVEIGAAGTDLGEDHHFRRPGHAEPGELHQIYRAGRRQARRRRRRFARRGRCRLCAERLAGRPDRQGGGARALHRGRHFGRDPASRRHEGLRR